MAEYFFNVFRITFIEPHKFSTFSFERDLTEKLNKYIIIVIDWLEFDETCDI